MPQEKKATLKEILNYEPEQYLSEDELSWIRSTFGNAKAIATMRKLLIPTINDPQLPIEQMGDDAFSAGLDWKSVPAEEAKIIATARQEAIKFVMGGLIKIKIIASTKEETPMEAALRRSKDSAQ